VLAAALLSLSPAAIALSQVLRPYSLNLFFESLAVLGLTARRHGDFKSARRLLKFGAAGAVLTHYGSFIFLGAVVLAMSLDCWTRRISFEDLKGRLADLQLAGGSVLLVAAINLQFTLGSRTIRNLKEGGWHDIFVHGVSDIPAAFLGALKFLGGPLLFWPIAFLLILNVRVAGRRSWLDSEGIAFLGIALGLLLSWIGIYPIGGTRHVFPLLPFFLLPAAQAFARSAAGSALLALATSATIVALVLAAPLLDRTIGGELRVAFPPDIEFSARTSDMLEAEKLLNLGEDSKLPIFIDEQTFYVMRPLLTRGSLGMVAPRKFRWYDHELTVSDKWRIGIEKGIVDEALMLSDGQPFPGGAIIFLSAGWDPTDLMPQLQGFARRSPEKMREILSREGVSAFRIAPESKDSLVPK
jgi:hypothetical protein